MKTLLFELVFGIIYPDDILRVLWDFMLLLLLGAVAILLPIELAFDKNGSLNSGWGIVSLLVDVVFSMVSPAPCLLRPEPGAIRSSSMAQVPLVL